jgi:hypothetical protein
VAKVNLTEIDYLRTKSVKQIQTFKVKVSQDLYKTKVENILPFRIRIENINLATYNANNPAPIGIAIIEKNNYVL